MTPVIADIGAPNCAELNLVAGDQQMVGDVGKHVLYTTITSKTTDNNGVFLLVCYLSRCSIARYWPTHYQHRVDRNELGEARMN